MTDADVDVADDEPAPSRSSLPMLLGLAAGVLLLTTIAFGILAVSYKSQRDESADERAAVATTAGELMNAMLSYDYTDPDGSLAAVLDRASGRFASEFQEAAPAIAQGLQAVEAHPSTVIRDVYVGSIGDDGTATAIVFYDQILDGVNGRSSYLDCYSRLQLARGPQGWTVNSVENLAGCGSADVAATPGDPTGTTAPADTTATTAAP